MTDDGKPNCKPFNAKVPTVKSARVPANPPKREYRDFDDYVRAGELLNEYYEYCCYGKSEGRWIDHEMAVEAYREYAKGEAFFERDELYKKTKTAKPNLIDTLQSRVIARRYVNERVGLLVGAFPNATPHSPEMYVRHLIEEIIAANPSASALEATCRKITRTFKFPPTVSELLKVLREQMERWEEFGCEEESDVEYWRKRLIQRRAEQEEAEARKKGEEAKREAEWRERQRQMRLEELKRAHDEGWNEILCRRHSLREAIPKISKYRGDDAVAFALGCFEAISALRRLGLLSPSMAFRIPGLRPTREQIMVALISPAMRRSVQRKAAKLEARRLRDFRRARLMKGAIRSQQ